MADMTVAEIDAEIAALRSYRSARLRGETRVKVGYEGVQVENALPTLEEIAQEIARLEAKKAAMTGQPSGGGPIRVGFGARP